ncbi:MAG: TIGR02217 family protein [Sphingopyxis sp.]|nr:TIGR02217 family protein [Sphingopyxis sp.]
MGWALIAAAEPHHRKGWLKRFDPRFWTVDFARPMMASVTSETPGALRVEAVFYRKQDLAGLIWEAEDRWDHPLLAYETKRDFRHTQLLFRWRSGGVKPLDALHGPTLTIEGRDAAGNPRAWYVRLWNYAEGTGEDALVSLDFDALDGGFLLPGEADPVWAGDVDRMFVSLVPPTFDGSEGVLPAPVEGWAEMSAIVCSGSGSVLGVGDAVMPEHGLGMTNGYDDCYHLTPARVVRQIVQLGYRGDVVHYVGMSHFMRLEALGGGFYISLAGGVLNRPTGEWHRLLSEECAAAGLGIIWSLSYELFDAYCWNDWKQRAADGSPALTGWVPPSTLLSPANAAAMGYLQLVARAFVAIGKAAGLAPQFQVGEPWWWVAEGGRICAYDAATTAALGPASVAIGDVRGTLDGAQRAMLDALGELLATSTAALVAAARDEAGVAGLASHLLVYLPSVLAPEAPEVRRANVPTGWAVPSFDVLQLEDYDWVTGGRGGETARARDAMVARLGYPAEEQHYFSGFVLRAEDRAQWAAIADAADVARRDGVARTFVWALPQVARDGFVSFDGEEEMQAFDAVDFPISIGREATALTEFSTQIVSAPSGHEQRASEWAEARMRYDAGPGVRSESDVRLLADFFRARRGAARAFRFRDPFDRSSAADGGLPGPADQWLGAGDGSRRLFALVKRYGSGDAGQVRAVRLPVAGSVRVAVDGIETAAFEVTGAGEVLLDVAPGPGIEVRAGFYFDVPVRFAEDRLEVSRATFLAGEVASVPLVEVRAPW